MTDPDPPARPAPADRLAELARAIAAVPLRDVKGYLCRAVRSKYLKNRTPAEPLYFLASARTGARFTPVGGRRGCTWPMTRTSRWRNFVTWFLTPPANVAACGGGTP